MHLSYSSNSGAARICQRGPKQGSEVTERGEGVGGVFPLPRGRSFLKICVWKRHFLHIERGLVSYVKWHIPIPYSPLLLKNYFTLIKGAGAWPLVPLAMPVTVVQPIFVNGGPKRGSEATERGEGVGGAFSCTLDTIIRGSLCSGIDQFPTLVLFSLFS